MDLCWESRAPKGRRLLSPSILPFRSEETSHGRTIECIHEY